MSSLNAVVKASRSFLRPDAGSQGMTKIGSEANIASMSGSMTSSNHSASAANLAMTTSTPSLSVKSNNAAATPTITVTNLVTVITDVQTLVTEVVGLCLAFHSYYMYWCFLLNPHIPTRGVKLPPGHICPCISGTMKDGAMPVSYTHLTLPTKRIV